MSTLEKVIEGHIFHKGLQLLLANTDYIDIVRRTEADLKEALNAIEKTLRKKKNWDS